MHREHGITVDTCFKCMHSYFITPVFLKLNTCIGAVNVDGSRSDAITLVETSRERPTGVVGFALCCILMFG